MSSAANQQRKAEILAKKAKLAELKRQRELRQKEFSQSRASTGDASEVSTVAPVSVYGLNIRTDCSRSCRQYLAVPTVELSSMT